MTAPPLLLMDAVTRDTRHYRSRLLLRAAAICRHTLLRLHADAARRLLRHHASICSARQSQRGFSLRFDA